MSHTRRWTSAALLLAASATIPAQSQSADSVRIRKDGTDKLVTQGHLIGRAGEKVLIEAYGETTGYAISPGYVFERYQPRRATTLGALTVGAIGAIVGMAMTPPADDPCPASDFFCNDPTFLTGTLYAISGFAVGAGVGALLGSLIKRKGWSGIDPGALPDNGHALSLNLAPGKVGLALRLRW